MAKPTRPRYLVVRSKDDVHAIHEIGDPGDSRKAAWEAIGRGSEVIAEIQRLGADHDWESLEAAMPVVNPEAQEILRLRLEAIHRFKVAPHHRQGLRLSARTGARSPRRVNALCLISGHEGQEIPGLVDPERVVVDAEHMEQALGPAAISEIFRIRKHIGESVYISTNVSETPQIVRAVETGAIDIRATAALAASKVVAALNAGADVVKVGFANTDPYKRDLKQASVLEQMKLIRTMVDDVVREGLLVYPLGRAEGRYPLVSVFFPEMGIDSAGDRPMDIALKGIDLTRRAGWQGLLLDTFEKYTGRRYADFYSVEQTAELARKAHAAGIELWIAGSIVRDEVAGYLRAGADLICFGGAARHEEGVRVTRSGGKPDESIRRALVEKLVAVFDEVDPKPPASAPGRAAPRAPARRRRA